MPLKEQVIRSVVSQFANPRGVFGRLAGWEMALRPSNRRRNLWAVGLLDLGPRSRFFEIGCGPGIAVREAARRAVDGYVAAIDRSDVMVAHARRRNRRAVAQGRVDIRVASVEQIPTFEEPFDAILAVNTIGFWTDPIERLKELRSLLRTGGTIAIVAQPRCPGATAAHTDIAQRESEERLAAAGFTPVGSHRLDLDPPVVCVLNRA